MKKILTLMLSGFILNTVFAQNTIVVQCLSDSGSFSLENNSSFYWSKNMKYFSSIGTPLAKTATIRIDKPQKLYFRVIFNKGVAEQGVFATPGDTVSFTTKIHPYYLSSDKFTYYAMHFSGKNAAHYNYDRLLDSLFPPRNEPYFKKGDDIQEFKNRVTQWRDQQRLFLEDYRKKFPLSDRFIEYAVANINATYTYQLYKPLYYNDIRRDSLPEDYFAEVDAIRFNNDDLVECYLSCLRFRYVMCYTDDIWSNFDSIYQNILQNFTGKTRAYLLSTLIGTFAEKQDPQHASQLLEAIKSAPEYVDEPEYLDFIKESEMNYLKVNKPVPDSILSATFLKPYGSDSFITLKEVLKKYEGQALYIDFWASWCSPCRYDISNSQEAKQFLKEKKVVYLYMSRDDEESKWEKAVEEDQISEDQYLIKDRKNSPLISYFNIYAIPQYIILDSDHKIKELQAPRPNESALPALKTSITNATRKIVRYD